MEIASRVLRRRDERDVVGADDDPSANAGEEMKTRYELDREERRVLLAALAKLKKAMQDEIDNEDAVTDAALSENRRVIGVCVRLGVRLRKSGKVAK